jgi:hypothetical protein
VFIGGEEELNDVGEEEEGEGELKTVRNERKK